MSSSSEEPWSDNPNAPQIPSWLHLTEKHDFTGSFISAILYGIVVALFFQCMSVLLNPLNPIRRGIKWALVAHTVVMFSLLTIPAAINLNDKSVFYINNREFPGNDEQPPGPVGYGSLVGTNATVHRCYIIYSANWWAMAFPCLLYLASVVMGMAYVYEVPRAEDNFVLWENFGTSYYSISLSLNITLTLMIVTRLILHRRNIRKAIGASDGSSGLYTAIVTMLIESYALYAIAYLLFLVLWIVSSPVEDIFSSALSSAQIIAPYLIIIRVAKRRALTNDTISGTVGSLRFGSQGSTTDGDGALPSGDDTMSPMRGMDGEAPSEGLGAGAEDAIEEVRL